MLNETITILNTHGNELDWQNELKTIYPNIKVIYNTTKNYKDIPADIWEQIDIITGFASVPPLTLVPRLKWVHLWSAGVNHVTNTELYKSNVVFTNSSAVHTVQVPEYVIMGILAYYKNLQATFKLKQQSYWPNSKEKAALSSKIQEVLGGKIQEIRGKTIGIVGYGAIGRGVAPLAKAFGLNVLALHRNTSTHVDQGFAFDGLTDHEGVIPSEYFTLDEDKKGFYELLSKSDIVLIALPLTDQTYHLFNHEVFEHMRNDALLINIARGEIIQQDNLIDALKTGKIGGAVLDVTTPEPLPSDSELWRLDNVILTPHISGHTPEYEKRVLEIFKYNFEAYLKDQPLKNIVDKKNHY